MASRWTKEETRRLKDLVRSGQYTYPEIGKILGRGRWGCTLRAQHLGLNNPTYQNRIIKHAHLREPVMRYFLKHSFEETRDRFGLTSSELKSLFTVAYRDPRYKKIRKDRRRKDVWSGEELRTFCRYSGLKPRAWIAKKLKRGTMQAVKEVASRLGTHTRYLNGLPERLAQTINPNLSGLKTMGGAPGRGGECCHRIVPWVALAEAPNSRKIHPEVRAGIRAMAEFQKWVHGTETMLETCYAVLAAIQEE